MDENNRKCECGCSNGIMKCGCWHGAGHQNWLLRVILGLVLLLIVFKIGFKLGEFRSDVRMMNYRGADNMMMDSQYYGAAAYDASDIGYLDF